MTTLRSTPILALVGAAGCGLFAGAMLCIGLALGGYWASLPARGFLDWFGANRHFIGRVIPVVALPALVGTLGSVWTLRRDPAARRPWIAAAACLGGVAAITVLHHLPVNARIVAGDVPPGAAASVRATWLWLHAARVALGLGALAVALWGLTRLPAR